MPNSKSAPPQQISPNQTHLLLQGDALLTTQALRSKSFDLIYLDPPFFTGRKFRAGKNQFQDVWQGKLEDYIGWLTARAEQMHHLLKPSGSIFLHLDWHAAHYAKVAMDEIFGRDNFINEIIWSYRTGGAGGRWLARKHDTILFYAKSPDYKFHSIKERSDLSHRYGFSNVNVLSDDKGHYRLALMRDVWEIPALRGNSPERVQFPTQKPVTLLERIIELVTDPGDLVGDFLCGSGTTLVAAAKSGRRIIGGDLSEQALLLTQSRLEALGQV